MNVAALGTSERITPVMPVSASASAAAGFFAAVDNGPATPPAPVRTAVTPAAIDAQTLLSASTIARPLPAILVQDNVTAALDKSGAPVSSDAVVASTPAITVKNLGTVAKSPVALTASETAVPMLLASSPIVTQAVVPASPVEAPVGNVATVRPRTVKTPSQPQNDSDPTVALPVPSAAVPVLVTVAATPDPVPPVRTDDNGIKPPAPATPPATARITALTSRASDISPVVTIATAAAATTPAKASVVQAGEPRHANDDMPVGPLSLDDPLPARPALGTLPAGSGLLALAVAMPRLDTVPVSGAALPLTQPLPIPMPVVSGHPGEIGRQVGVEIARRISAGGDELTVRLDPAEMGRIEVRISFNDRGSLRAIVAADSPVSLDLLRRDSGDLNRALADAGVRADAQSFHFDTRGGGEQSSQSQRHPAAPVRRYAEAAAEFENIIYRPVRTRGRIDLLA